MRKGARRTMLYELGCPVEILAVEADREGGLSVRAFNHGDRRVSALEGIVKGRAQQGAGCMAMPLRVEGLHALPGKAFSFGVKFGMSPEEPGVALKLTRVRFEGDPADWKSGAGRVVQVDAFVPMDEQAQARAAQSAGRRVLCLPRSYGDAWRCTCGRIVDAAQDSCPSCLAGREEALAFDAEACRPAVSVPTRARTTKASERASGFDLLRRTAAVVFARLR